MLRLKHELIVAYQKNNQIDIALIADSSRGLLFLWPKEESDPFLTSNQLQFEKSKEDSTHKMIKSISGLDISMDNQKILIEFEYMKLNLLELDSDNKSNIWKQSEKFHYRNNNIIYLSKFSSKNDHIHNVMIENNIFKICEWGENGEMVRHLDCRDQVLKMIHEPSNDNLIILTSKKEKKSNCLELVSLEKQVSIKLSDFEDANPENFFFVKEKNDIILAFSDKVKIYHDFYKNPRFLLGKKKNLITMFTSCEKEKAKLPTLSTKTRLFPFNYNFLQILSYNKDFLDVRKKIFKIMSEQKNDKKIDISFELFFQKDIHDRNCFDIAFLSKDSNLFKDLLIFLMENFNMAELSSKCRDYLNSNFFYKMFLIFEDHPIISQFLNFVFSIPLEFPKNFTYKRLNEPKFFTLDDVYLPKAKIKEKLDEITGIKKSKNKQKEESTEIKQANEVVLAKCFYPYEFLDKSNHATREIFKLVSKFDRTNSIFGNEAIIKILEYKWMTYAKNEFFIEGLWFLVFLVVYVINVDYFFVCRIGSEELDSDSEKIYELISGSLNLVILVFIIWLARKEQKQLRILTPQYYFSSFWNYNDVSRLIFV